MTPGARLAAPWDPVEEVWISWPEDPAWPELERARESVAALCAALTDFERPADRPRLRVCLHSDEGMQSARVVLGAFRPDLPRVDLATGFDGCEPVLFWRHPRRTSAVAGLEMPAPMFQALDRLTRRASLQLSPAAIALMRGALETDGEGTALLTREHWFRPGWNQGFNIHQLESVLAEDFGIRRCLWLDRGLPGAPGHGLVAPLVRFAAPGKVLCQRPVVASDPHAGLYRAVGQTLRHARDAADRRLEVIELPAPAPVVSGRPLPLSHLDFLRVENLIVVPVFTGGEHRDLREAFARALPDCRLVLHQVSPELGTRRAFYGLALTVPA
jgi:agmatine deiminase